MENMKTYNFNIKDFSDIFNDVFKDYPEGVVCKDSELKYLASNKAYCSLFGLNNDDSLCGKSENKYLPPKVICLIKDADKEVMQTMLPLNYVVDLENNIILNITSAPIAYADKFLGIISIVRDITQEESIKEDFVKRHFSYIDAERRLQIQRESFVASLGHDLKNPTIAQIRGIELLLKGAFGELNKEQTELLSMILDSCRYMSGMLSSLLDTYRNYDGKIKFEFSEFSLADLVNECVSEMLYVARDKDVKINCQLLYTGNIYADKVQIRRVIMNLLSNAIKYAYKGTELNLNLHKERESINFEFINRSPYITEEKRKSIFARYVSYAEEHKVSGTGLGLYASKKIIESHNGKIYVKSYKDERNIFGFLIPIKQAGCADKNFL